MWVIKTSRPPIDQSQVQQPTEAEFSFQVSVLHIVINVGVTVWFSFYSLHRQIDSVLLGLCLRASRGEQNQV